MKMTDKNKYSYLVTAQPIDRYFFGSEKTFLPADGSKVNYLVRSMIMPQQTTLLGMMRYAILNNLMDSKSVSVIKTDSDKIGSESFNISNTTGYGIIDSLSPLFLMYEEKGKKINIDLLGFDHQLYNNQETKSLEKVVFRFEDATGNSNTISNNNFVPQLDKFDHKQHNQMIWQNKETKDWLTEEDIFGRNEQPGNQKSYTGEALKDAFYKQTFCYLKKGYRFGFYVELNDKLETPCFFKVLMGADQSEFKITIEEVINHFDKEVPVEVDVNSMFKVSLLSDAYMTNENLSLTDFSINEIIDFRYIMTDSTIQNFAELDTTNIGKITKGRPVKSTKIQLIEKGSVFYIKGKNLQSFIENIKAQKAFKKIGYNNFKTEKI